LGIKYIVKKRLKAVKSPNFGEKVAGFETVFLAPSPTHISEFLSDFTPLFFRYKAFTEEKGPEKGSKTAI
jgi:hypothetical protein